MAAVSTGQPGPTPAGELVVEVIGSILENQTFLADQASAYQYAFFVRDDPFPRTSLGRERGAPCLRVVVA
ncbi:hypothetical protein RSSM_01665 [Rhodopirellula sallentina SM41]|uniref:Uncharacterized protein n=1 Tax=Rhodopirellula sallentina SM41 TaxID=1263870 RepID=M5U616_9BACT|nr:hypothetical protein RSSM_01665 [Rhodopirellula sallentina SM41]